MADDPIFDAYTRQSFRPTLVARDDPPSDLRAPLVLHPARLPDPAAIPPRRWLYGTQLIRGYVTVLVAPGGTGKSAYAMAVALCLASNRPFLGEHIFAPVKAAICNLEDPLEELERRLAALMIRQKIPSDDVNGRIFMDDGEGRGLTIAAFGDDGFSVVYPDEAALIREIKHHGIGLAICDPVAESHTLEENSNPHMVKASAAWRRVARSTGCAVLLVHHVRKGDATGIDAARGAKALTDSARVGLLMCPMSQAEGENLGIDAADCWQYVRLDDAKRNMAPAGKAKWFKLDQVGLPNGTPEYPNGDKVAAIIAWEPPNVWQDISPAEINQALDAIRDGPGGGVLFTATRRGGSNRWAGQILCDAVNVNEKQASKMIQSWINSGLLWEDSYLHPEWRRQARGVRVNENLRPT